MGGAEDLPKRASSPLKRPASDLEPEDSSSQKEDVDMITVPSSDPEVPAGNPLHPSETTRGQSVNMIDNEMTPAASDSSKEQPVISRARSPQSEIPDIDAQIATVTTMIKAHAEAQPQENDKVFIVSRRWLKRVLDRGTEARKNSKEEPEGEIGPIDNSDIIQQIIKDCDGVDFVQLKHGLGSESFELFPEDAWTMVLEWYGLMAGSIPIERIAHNTNPGGELPNILFEFHPPIFTIHRLFSGSCPINLPQLLKASNPTAPIIVASQSSKYNDLLKRAKQHTSIPLTQRVRVWRVPRLQPAAEPTFSNAGRDTPPASRPSSPLPAAVSSTAQRSPQDSWTHTLLDVASFTQLEQGNGRELVDRPDSSTDSKYNGSSDLSMAGLGDDQTLVLDEHISGESFVANYVSKGTKSGPSTALVRTGATSQPNSGRSSPAPSGPMTRGRTQKNGRVAGTVGLSNLGNTCYMNSALQCVRSVEELTKYFLSGAVKSELNRENPLGNNGEVAVSYWRLLEEIYKDPTPTSISPRSFKGTIGKFAPSFSGYGQQDSQEFLGFLLDGLQEDLSRVKNKPYIEKPDSTDEMVNNPEAIREMAAKVWDITKKRDDSVIADLFTGLYKSTLVCPVCDKVSITFDPFNAVTLQLPIEDHWAHVAIYYPLNDTPRKISIDLRRQANFSDLKEFISSRVGVPTERLFAAEEFKGKFYKVYKDESSPADDVSSNDTLAIHELEAKPTNWPPKRKPQKKQKYAYSNNDSEDDIPEEWDDPMADKMLVPVFHRKPNPDKGTSRFRKAWVLPGVPHYIVVTPEEAGNEEIIQRKVLEKIATLSTAEDLVDDDVSEIIDSDLVITNGSDADSSGSSKVVANSVDGDDDLVDVSKTGNGAEESPIDTQNKLDSKPPRKLFNDRRPKFLDPNVYLDGALQNMFVLGYVPRSNDMIPTGWNSVDEDKIYRPLSSRCPPPPPQPDDSLSNGYGANGRSGSVSSNEDDGYNAGNSATRMNDESDEDEQPVRKVLPVRSAPVQRSVGRVAQSKKNARKTKTKTYSKKGQKFIPRKLHQTNEHMEDNEMDLPNGGPLIRLGEGVVVDWNENAWDSLFGGSGDDTMRGRETYRNIPLLEDPDLIARRIARNQKKKNGITLDECLDESGRKEILSEMDQWYCPRCKEHRRASKKLELWKTPDILAFHLKRFSSAGFRRDKLDVLVDFPMEGLDLSTRVLETEEGKEEIYDLIAVDDHWGGLGGGHYTAFAKNFVDHEWYEYNDSSVSKVKDLTRIISKSAYLLFYRRRSDKPLGGPRLEQIVQDHDNTSESQPPSEDEKSEPGEDRGLVANSSLRGSSSPLTGVGAVRHQQNLGFTGDSNQHATINPSALDKLPIYQELDEDVPMLIDDNAMDNNLHTSIEEDEGIDMDPGTGYVHQPYNSNFKSLGIAAWSFDSLDVERMNQDNRISGTGSDAASDLVQDNSSADEGSRRGRLDDFDNAIPEDFIDQSPVPDLDEDGQAVAIALHHDLLDQLNHNVLYPYSGNDNPEVEEPATEIHIGEGDELKMD